METRYFHEQAVHALGISPTSTSRLIEIFAPDLPDYVQAQDDGAVALSDTDLQLLRVIVQLVEHRPQGTSRAEILQAIRASDVLSLLRTALSQIPIQEDIEGSVGANEQEMVAGNVAAVFQSIELVDAIRSLVQRQGQQIDHLQGVVEHLIQKNEEFQRQLDRRPDQLWSERQYWRGLAIGITVGLLLGVILIVGASMLIG